MKLERIERGGERYVLVPENEFARLQEALEDLDDIRAYDRAKAKPQEFIPAAYANRIIDGESPIRVYREYRGLTQEQLAGKAGITKPYLSQLETGARNPSIDTAKALAEALNVDVDDLV
ncbi:helix-turn-helix transcriptional regulator [Azospirillum sp.]|uniref:helix-turn-helix domain-containing protein n=1 Tax=Azospirillum sp. TaxID=34012 RepID=UPI002D40574E|nr:helix-turn-helix transcriptional regulator [Azospirillum sp.]HYD66722.1 helix-turn-helix transcriptional regulator [Azospirillum sp.]